MKELTEIDKAWSAAFIDGEGCITCYKRSDNCDSCVGVVYASQSKSAMIDKLIQVTGLGNCLIKKDKYGGCFCWQVKSLKALDFLTAIEPYLILKKEQANLIIKLIRTQNLLRQSVGTVNCGGIWQFEIYNKIRRLNKTRERQT